MNKETLLQIFQAILSDPASSGDDFYFVLHNGRLTISYDIEDSEAHELLEDMYRDIKFGVVRTPTSPDMYSCDRRKATPSVPPIFQNFVFIPDNGEE